MQARDVMTSPVVSAAGDMTVRDVAQLLLKNRISAVPILDAGGAPLGMVSEGDLIGRDEAQRDERSEWWLALLAEGEALSPDFLSNLRRPERVASEVMSKPVVTVEEQTEIGEIARLLSAYRIKRVPVVREGKVVGIVSRENLLRTLVVSEGAHHSAEPRLNIVARALEDTLAPLRWHFERPHHEPTPQPPPLAEPDDLSSDAGDFRRLAQDFKIKEGQRREEQRHIAEDKRHHEAEELIGKHISDAGWRHLVHEARVAAEQGLKEFLLLRFPSEVCSDGGRAINAPNPDWPDTLRGEAAEIYLRWTHDLKPHGFHLRARVVDFPDGLPGDIGLFLAWG